MLRESLDQEFKRVEWERALEFILDRLKRIRDRYGPESLHIHLSQGYDFGNLMLGERFGSIFGTPFVVHPATSRHHLFSMQGWQRLGLSMNFPPDWVYSKTILIVGADIAATQPVNMGWVLDAKERGAKVIGVDSRLNSTMSKADLFLRCRPGAESAVLMAIARVIIAEGLHRQEFLKKWVNGISRWMDLCDEYKPEKAEEISWVPSEKIREAAFCMAKHRPCQILAVDYLGSPYEGSRFLQSCLGLICLTGSIGVSGGGLNLLTNFPPINPVADLEGASWQSSSHEKMDSHDSLGTPSKSEKKEIRAIIWDGDSLRHFIRRKRFSKVKGNLELVVHLSLYPNSSWSCSHVSLPMASWLESEGLIAYGSTRSLQWHNQIIPPLGKCRTYSDFWAVLADGFGWGHLFPWMTKDEGVDIRRMSDFFLSQERLTAGCSVDILDPEKNPPGGILWPCPRDEVVSFSHEKLIRGEEVLFQRGKKFPGEQKRFPTPSGKIEFPEVKERKKEIDVESMLIESRYPLLLTTGILVNQIDGLGFWLPWLNEIQPPLFIQIHPDTAQVLEIRGGDHVIIENPITSLEGLAWVTSIVAPQVVWCSNGTDKIQPHAPFQNVQELANIEEADFATCRLHGIPVMVYRKGDERSEVFIRLKAFLLPPERIWDFHDYL
jgi:anaerobic selenocysteine-containing dehydrogenase